MVFALSVIFISACALSSPAAKPPVVTTPVAEMPVVPTFPPQTVTIGFLQRGINVLPVNTQGQWRITLKPEPFTLSIHGNRDMVSLMALQSGDLVLPLKQVTQPLVAPVGTGMLFYDNNLHLVDQLVEISAADEAFFRKYNFSDAQSQSYTEFLKSQLVLEPLVITSPRIYLDVPRGISEYTVKTINETAIQNGDSVTLVVFSGQKLEQDGAHLDWSLLKWLVIDVNFLD
jgi:hypothetical protein